MVLTLQDAIRIRNRYRNLKGMDTTEKMGGKSEVGQIIICPLENGLPITDFMQLAITRLPKDQDGHVNEELLVSRFPNQGYGVYIIYRTRYSEHLMFHDLKKFLNEYDIPFDLG